MQGIFKTSIIAIVIHLLIIGGIILASRNGDKAKEPVKKESHHVAKPESTVAPSPAVNPLPPAVKPPANKIRFPLKGHNSEDLKPKRVEQPKARPVEKPKAVEPPRVVEKPIQKPKVVEPPKEKPKRVPVKIGKRVERSVDVPKEEPIKRVPIKLGRRIEASPPPKAPPKRVEPEMTISDQIQKKDDELDAWLKGRERVPVQAEPQAAPSVDPPVYNY